MTANTYNDNRGSRTATIAGTFVLQYFDRNTYQPEDYCNGVMITYNSTDTYAAIRLVVYWLYEVMNHYSMETHCKTCAA